MRPACRLLLAATAALAAMVFMATSALGQSIEIHPEDDSTHCSDITTSAGHSVTGGCRVHIISEANAQTLAHNGFSEVMTSSCGNEFDAYLDEHGVGYMSVNDTSIQTGVGCGVTPCDESGAGGETTHPELEWPISGISEYGTGREAMDFTFCIRPSNNAESVGNAFCTVIVDIVNVPGDHQQELIADQEPCFQDPALELTGHWITEAVPQGEEVEIELEHIHLP
jgi:hypothetical protein